MFHIGEDLYKTDARLDQPARHQTAQPVARRFRSIQPVHRAGRLALARRVADLAVDLGFADQAHLNRDFRLLGGTTPKTFAENVVPDEITATIAE